eukprot:CAMPEP_0197690888 /NCGR_PEP_ID=MMETSP1338-20131121/108984_1 /TAXON_ID=43686 ORGANISM="Pelagodinium beii, Strain RCC1491" /NCGR_SAMPLE_ID=MMETSP1338 /ASSEMBLY_ACC=CAM_ASM_000754 /LENGTH=56 /DNA_ID=CAMNT_0043273383 /DNA_START=16 /DNA_END=183 /DNA_ORIENTATION=+
MPPKTDFGNKTKIFSRDLDEALRALEEGSAVTSLVVENIGRFVDGYAVLFDELKQN